MLEWYPKVKSLDIPQPQTEMVEIPNEDFLELVGSGNCTLRQYQKRFSDILDSLAPFPVFLRSDCSSQKHSFKRTCRLPDKKSLLGHILELVDLNFACGLTDNALVFRKWLDLDAGFAAFDGLPINTEARVFLNRGKVQCIHPYWPEEVIESWIWHRSKLEAQFGGKLPNAINPRWREILKSQNDMVTKSRPILEKYSRKIIDRIGDGYWSADFAFCRDGLWYMIDMAKGDVSYHHPACRFDSRGTGVSHG